MAATVRRHLHITLAGLIAFVVLLGVSVSFTRHAHATQRLSTTSHQLAAARTRSTARAARIRALQHQVRVLDQRLVASRRQAHSLGARLGDANTRLTGLKGSLAAASHDRETLRQCFRGIMAIGRAYERGDVAGMQTAAQRSEAACRASEHLI